MKLGVGGRRCGIAAIKWKIATDKPGFALSGLFRLIAVLQAMRVYTLRISVVKLLPKMCVN